MLFEYVGKERLQELREGIRYVEKMLKAMSNSLGNEHLNPRILDPLGPLLSNKAIPEND